MLRIIRLVRNHSEQLLIMNNLDDSRIKLFERVQRIVT